MSAAPASRRKRAERAELRGGFREGSGRKSLFPGKTEKVTVKLTPLARDAAQRTADHLSTSKPRIRTAQDVDVVTLSDAVEYLIRKGSGTALDA